mgnify:CR=1 FL=1
MRASTGEHVPDNKVKLDETDRLVAAALQVNGRATWGDIARAINLPERTVTRRGQRLFARGLVRVSMYVDPMRALHARAVILRIKTEDAELWSVARTLARRADASSVSVLEGSNDIAAMLLPRDEASVRSLLFKELPSIAGTKTINVTTVFKFFRSGHDWQPDLLTASQARMLDVPGPTEVDPADSLSKEEEQLITLLLRDGRMPVAQLARSLGANITTTRRRMDSLAARGLMHPRTEVVPRVFGLGLEALVWLRVPLAKLEEVGRALAAAPEIKFVVATTGTSQLLINVLVRNENAFYQFLTGPVFARYEGLEVVEALRIITPVLRGALMVDEAPADIEGDATVG